MEAKLSDDKEWVKVDAGSTIEQAQLNGYFVKKIPDWFIIKKKCPWINVNESFIFDGSIIPVGLWIELIKMCKKFGIPLTFKDDFEKDVCDTSITLDCIKKYYYELFANAKIAPKDYQIECIYNILNYKKCCVEISTNGGKTLICYMLFKYLRDVISIKHILYVTPKTNLTTQSGEKFFEYDSVCGIDSNWTSEYIHGAVKKKTTYDSDIVFGNYQSLCRKNADFFDAFDCVLVDECHHSSAKSIRNIIKKCRNVKYKVGLTGTFPKEDTYDNFLLQSVLGPLVYRLTSYELINKENFATPVYITGIRLKYLSDEREIALYNLRSNKDKNDPTVGGKLYNMEKDIVRSSDVRFKYVCNLIKKLDKNTLVIFSDIKNDYGRRIYENIKETSNKNAFYIDGSTPTDNRDYAKQCMENDMEGSTVIVSSVGCFSEGIDIANLWNIFLCESTKSDVIMAQLLGRGMRRFEGKDKTMFFDICDDFSTGEGMYSDNYLVRHFKERIGIYKKRGFPYKIYDVNLKSSKLLYF